MRPLRRVDHDPELGADVLRVVGYVAHCPCGWQGDRRDVFAVARSDLTGHKMLEHGHR